MFKKASKKQSKLRLALFGPSGGGKTYTALRIATGMGGKIAVVDSEKGSASKYADRFNFDVAELEKPSVDNYIKLIREAAHYDVLIIDSLSHGWQELLEEVDRIARSKYRGNTWAAWQEGTPKQKALVETILNFNGHIIATMRAKTEWTVETDDNGKSKPVRLCLAPSQGKGIEYEFDLLMQISTDHIAQVIKDRTGKFQDALVEKPGEEFGKDLNQWLCEGDIPEPKTFLFPIVSGVHEELHSLITDNFNLFSDTHIQWVVDQVKANTNEQNIKSIINHVHKVIDGVNSKAV